MSGIYRSPAWARIQRRIAARASEWEEKRAAERAEKEKAAAVERARLDAIVEKVVAYVEDHLDKATVARAEGQYPGNEGYRLTLTVPVDPTWGIRREDTSRLIGLMQAELSASVKQTPGGFVLGLPLVTPPPMVSREPYLYQSGFVEEGTALTHTWTFIGIDKKTGGFEELLEFDPLNGCQGQGDPVAHPRGLPTEEVGGAPHCPACAA